MGVYLHMSDHDVWSYKTLKEYFMKRFILTEGGYRKRFKQSKIENRENPDRFIDRLRRYLQMWRQKKWFVGLDPDRVALYYITSRYRLS